MDALGNTLYVNSKFRDDLYKNPLSSLQDAITQSHNLIKMEEDTRAILTKQNASKQAASKNTDTRQEPRQHSSNDKTDRKNFFLYIVDEEELSKSAVVFRKKDCNHWDHPTNKKTQTPRQMNYVLITK